MTPAARTAGKREPSRASTAPSSGPPAARAARAASVHIRPVTGSCSAAARRASSRAPYRPQARDTPAPKRRVGRSALPVRRSSMPSRCARVSEFQLQVVEGSPGRHHAAREEYRPLSAASSCSTAQSPCSRSPSRRVSGVSAVSRRAGSSATGRFSARRARSRVRTGWWASTRPRTLRARSRTCGTQSAHRIRTSWTGGLRHAASADARTRPSGVAQPGLQPVDGHPPEPLEAAHLPVEGDPGLRPVPDEPAGHRRGVPVHQLPGHAPPPGRVLGRAPHMPSPAGIRP
ncbi:hypothetical protein VR44_15380 [Streptomyces katrae]|uniref:Uncharacterized protein n=1 Tax=Streptomyces katrae TaxID=68223 RepID=A0A0F4JG24_9ACTN|nr:hypothetical protein VR44_15380 [Streptomyces katrae]